MFRPAAAASLVLLSCLPAHADPFHVVPVSAMPWAAAPASLPKGGEFALIQGDPVKPGPFVFRVRMPAGYVIAPHTHPAAEYITVISGTFYHGMGDTMDKGAATRLSAGDFVYLPPGMGHSLWTTPADGPATIQVNGTGPFTIHYIRPSDDPRNLH